MSTLVRPKATVMAALVASSLLAFTPSIAHAEPTAADRETARGLMDRGYERLKQGDSVGALKDFEGADALVGVTSTRLAVGLALEKLGRLVEARDRLLEVSRIATRPGESPQIREARAKADELQRTVGERIPSLKIELTGLPEGATPALELDGVALPSAALGLPRRVDPGNHRIVGKVPGFVAAPLEVSLAEREQRSVTLAFAPEARPVAAKKPAAVKTTAARPMSEVAPGSSPFASPLFLTGVSLAGAGLLAGSVTGALSLAAADDVKAVCPDLVCRDDSMRATAERSLLLAHASTGSFALAGAGAAVAVVSLLLPAPALVAAALRVEPLVGPGSVGLRGRF
ncbi:MAG: hypothetical protein FJ095_02185 [Deltaproteobacteria bacterium]|nr:hypothetical protein [Deltaproteobacteria bacterium]